MCPTHLYKKKKKIPAKVSQHIIVFETDHQFKFSKQISCHHFEFQPCFLLCCKLKINISYVLTILDRQSCEIHAK